MPESSQTATADLAGARRRARVRYNAVLKIVRRAHMYAGLFMSPWVFLYGVTAFLFNHPDAFPDREVRTFGPSEVVGTPLEGVPTADRLAAQVVGCLDADGATFRMVRPEAARYSRDLIATAIGHGREHDVRIDLESVQGTVRSSEATPDHGSTWPAGSRIDPTEGPRDRLARGIPAVLARLGLDAETVSIRNPPDLIFFAESGGTLWRVAYNIQSGAVSGRAFDSKDDPLTTRRFLTGLHLARGYPARVDPRWFWAVVVDAMFVMMIFWALSGILMWWQLRSLRRSGIAVLAVSIAVATAMAIGMHEMLAG
jgi:hypothetical protein